MNFEITTDDVCEFFLKHNIVWDKLVDDYPKRKANFKILENRTWIKVITINGSKRLCISVTESEFLTYDNELWGETFINKDISHAWQNFLLSKYKQEYANFLFEMLNKSANKVNMCYEKVVLDCNKKIQQAKQEQTAKISKINEQIKMLESFGYYPEEKQLK